MGGCAGHQSLVVSLGQPIDLHAGSGKRPEFTLILVSSESPYFQAEYYPDHVVEKGREHLFSF